jgi:hypothetical protein
MQAVEIGVSDAIEMKHVKDVIEVCRWQVQDDAQPFMHRLWCARVGLIKGVEKSKFLLRVQTDTKALLETVVA